MSKQEPQGLSWPDPTAVEQAFGGVAAKEPERWFQFEMGDSWIWVRLAQTNDGRLILTGLLLGAGEEKEITSRGLREIGWDKVLEYVANMGLHKSRQPGQREWPFKPARVVGAKRLPREHFERVAQAYRVAVQRDPRAPIPQLAAVFATSLPTMARWVAKCRSMGLLGPAIRGRAGEKPTTKRRKKS
jgi:hypothetical protein